MQTYLESIGCVAHTASNGDEAMQVVSSGIQPDALPVDFGRRNHESGLAVVARSRGALTYDLPAIIASGDTDPERIRDAVVFGSPVLHEPIPTRLLLETLSRALGDRRIAAAETVPIEA